MQCLFVVPDQQTVVLREDVVNTDPVIYGLLSSDNSKACSHQYSLHLRCPITNNSVTVMVKVTGGW